MLEEEGVDVSKDLLANVGISGGVKLDDVSTVEAVIVVHDEAVHAELQRHDVGLGGVPDSRWRNVT